MQYKDLFIIVTMGDMAIWDFFSLDVDILKIHKNNGHFNGF